MEYIKKNINEYEVENELDLHGHAVDEALDLCEDFILGCQRAGYQCVRIIHGASRTRVGPYGTIKDNLRQCLKSNWKKQVAHFQFAKAHEGGAGATIVFLK